MLQKTTELPWKYVHTPLFTIKAGYKQQYDSKTLVCKFQKHLLSLYYSLGILPGVRDTIVNQLFCPPRGIHFCQQKRKVNRQNYIV